jgi:hypothetical protein
MLEALARLAAGEAQDPDYGTALPAGGGFASVEYDGTAVVVGLADDTWVAKPAGMTARQAKLAAQQVVYTLQGIQQDRVPVKVTGPDGQPSTFLGFDTSAGLEAAGQSAVLALVNVTEPAEGAAVSGTFTASGVANSFEATVPWHVEDQSGATVLEGFATADGWADKLYPWQAQVDVSGLAPGTYTFVATTDDASDGEGAGPTRDTKTITVY